MNSTVDPTAARDGFIAGEAAASGAKPMRVLHVVETWRPVSSGYTSRGWQIVAEQAARPDCEPFVFVSSRQHLHGIDRAEVPAAMAPARVAHSPIDERALRRLRPFHVAQGALERQIVAEARRRSIDLIHCHWSSSIGMAAARAARRLELPLVGEVRFDLAGAMMSETVRLPLPGLEQRLRRHFDRYLRQADAIVAASHSLARLVARTQGRAAAAVPAMPNAVDCERFSPAADGGGLRESLGLSEAFVIGSTTNMLRYEGLDLLLDAASRLRDRYASLAVVLVGNGTQYDSLRARAEREALPVVFTDRVPAEDVPRYLNLMDLFVIPRRDGAVTRYASPIKLMEAMACGVPTVGSDLGDIADILAGGGGQVVPPDDVEALAAAIAGLIDDPDRLERQASAARRWALSQPTWSDLAARYVTLYRDLSTARLSRAPR